MFNARFAVSTNFIGQPICQRFRLIGNKCAVQKEQALQRPNGYWPII